MSEPGLSEPRAAARCRTVSTPYSEGMNIAVEQPPPDRDSRFGTLDVSGMTVPQILTSRGARRWFLGALVSGLLSLAANAHGLLQGGLATWLQGLGLLHALVFMIVFALVPPLSWGRTEAAKLALLCALFLLSIPFLALNGPGGAWMWTYVTVAAGMQMHPRRIIITLLAMFGAASWALQLAGGMPWDVSLTQPALVVAMGMMMAAFGAQIATVRELRRTQHELAELAVREERSRVARDMHDILGHSLTVITVKAELAGRLLDIDPPRAAAQIADLEELARGALADVRSTVSGYREVNVGAELANARAALSAARIEAALPGTADTVPVRYRELFGWVLREGITNVVRHSGAGRCTVELGADFIQIDDDGAGPGPGTAAAGGGLGGLGERARAAGAAMSIGTSELGGFSVRVQL